MSGVIKNRHVQQAVRQVNEIAVPQSLARLSMLGGAMLLTEEETLDDDKYQRRFLLDDTPTRRRFIAVTVELVDEKKQGPDS